MTTKNLFLFLAITTILFASPFAINSAFAQQGNGNNNQNSLKGQVSTNTAAIDSFFDIFTEISILFNVDSFFDVFTEIQATDANLQSQIDAISEGPTADMTFDRLTDTATSGHLVGWNPDGNRKFFSITEPSVMHTGVSMSVVSISLHDVDALSTSLPICSVLGIGGVAQGGVAGFNIGCTNAPGEHSILGYSVLNP